jgi:zinc protease
MTRGLLRILCVAALGFAAVIAAAEVPGVSRDVLPGGLRLLVREDPNAEIVSVSLQVRTGSRYETQETSGLSHFVQRMMLRGTARRSARLIVETAEDLGGSIEASSDVESGEIRGSSLAAHQDALLQLIAEIALMPTFPAEELERERRLILSQIQTRAETPLSLALDTLAAELYGSHPFGLPILGQKSSLQRLGRSDLVAHYLRVYRAGATVLSVSGRVERDRIRRQVEQLFGRMPPGDVDEPVDAAPTPSAERRVLSRPVQQTRLVVGFLGPGIGHPDYAPGKVMTAILGGGASGRLFVKLRGDEGLAYSVGMLQPSRRGPGNFIAYVATSDTGVERAEAATRQTIERFRAEGPSGAEVARAKAYVLGNLAMDRRTNARQAWYLAFFELIGAGWDYPDRYARALETVTAEDVIRVARRYLDRPTTVVVRPRS